MSPSPEEAAQALRAINSVQARAAGFQDYRAESLQLMLWGVANLLGCVFTALFPQLLLLIWLVVVIAWLVSRRKSRRVSFGATYWWWALYCCLPPCCMLSCGRSRQSRAA